MDTIYLILYHPFILMIYHIDDIPEITITNPDDETLTYFDPKNPGGDIE